MKPIRSLLFVITIAVTFATALPANAAIDFTWSFDPPLPAIGTPTTVFSMPARLVVDIESDDFFVGGVGIMSGSFAGEYIFTPDISLLLDTELQAGDTATFNFGFFTPVGAAPPGDYEIVSASLLVVPSEVAGPPTSVFSSNLFSARVVADGVVPEPATLVLLGSGLAGVAAWRRRRK